MVRKQRGRILRNTVIVVLLIIALIGSIYLAPMLGQQENLGDLIAGASMVIALVSAILIVMQLYDAKKLQEAEFVLNLNQSFVENENYASMYTRLEELNRLAEQGKENPGIKIERVEVSNYLTFFEAIFLLLQQKVINIKILDDLFAYRFFLAVHNEFIQQIKLVDSPYNFRNIYYLEHIWIKYRKAHNLKIYRENMCLEKSCERAGKKDIYDDIIQGSK